MVVFCYHNGALGHVTSALIECCTQEGKRDFPFFYQAESLHYYIAEQKLFCIKHPKCDIAQEKKLGNSVISASSFSDFGRYLILLMGLKKWNNKQPEYNHQVTYKQQGDTYGEQLEILSLTLQDKVKLDTDWFVNADYVLDITEYWHNPHGVAEWLTSCGFTPNLDQVKYFCQQVVKTNQVYYNTISKCVEIVDAVTANINQVVDLSFYEIAMCHSMLLSRYKKSHTKIQLLKTPPSSTRDLANIFYD
jgi:hypothetical protein